MNKSFRKWIKVAAKTSQTEWTSQKQSILIYSSKVPASPNRPRPLTSNKCNYVWLFWKSENRLGLSIVFLKVQENKILVLHEGKCLKCQKNSGQTQKWGKLKCEILTHQRAGIFGIYFLHISISGAHSQNKRKKRKVVTGAVP